MRSVYVLPTSRSKARTTAAQHPRHPRPHEARAHARRRSGGRSAYDSELDALTEPFGDCADIQLHAGTSPQKRLGRLRATERAVTGMAVGAIRDCRIRVFVRNGAAWANHGASGWSQAQEGSIAPAGEGNPRRLAPVQWNGQCNYQLVIHAGATFCIASGFLPLFFIIPLHASIHITVALLLHKSFFIAFNLYRFIFPTESFVIISTSRIVFSAIYIAYNCNI